MEYAGIVTQYSNEQNKCYHYMHIWLVEALWLTSFAKSQFFPTVKEYIYLTTKLVENIENGKPHLNPN